ncbi:MAG: thioredoxin [Actinobacteria bacterium HGW-Actinobacteria-6]|jgi:thioredoxin 1|nr:MAG: thioredoxin [Actinobacteria bacterium HGW-Actinobacteria-6]
MSEGVKEISESEFQAEVLDSAETVVVDFWAPWCGPCKMVGPELEKLAARTSGVKFVKVNVDESREVAIKYGVMSIPTIAKFESGNLVSQVVGARSADALGREFGLA